MSSQIIQEIQKLTIIDLDPDDFIGGGTNGQVYRYWINNTRIALKCFKNEKKAQDEMTILNGIQNLISNCPGILDVYGMKKIQIKMHHTICEKFVIFLQGCEIDLQKKMLMTQKLQLAQVFDLLSQLSLSLLCIHMNNCFHGDIKPGNILVNQNNQQLTCYLTDYGEGKIVGNYISTNFDTLKLRGTIPYFAPELLKIYNNKKISGNYNPLSTDIYALGITILSLLVPKQLLKNLSAAYQNQQQYDSEILNIKQELLKISELKNNSGNQLLNTILGMVNFDPLQRPSAIELCFEIVQSKQLCMNALSFNNVQALTIQLIKSLYWQKKQKKELLEELESQKTIIEILQNQASQQINPKNQPTIPKNFEIPSFSSDIIKNPEYMNIILALFENTNISLKRIHQQLNITKFNASKFHDDCDGKGPTLIIMHSQQEPNSFFGGMAASSWNQENKMIADPSYECSWIFKIESIDSKLNLHQWKCINKIKAIAGFPEGFQFGVDFAFTTGASLSAAGLSFDTTGLTPALVGVLASFGTTLAAAALTGTSKLIANDEYYQKVQFKKETNILVELQKKFQINFPSKVFGKIMNEEKFSFQLNALEVFSIKK